MLSLPNLLTLSRILAVPILVFLLWRPAPWDYAITFVLYCVGQAASAAAVLLAAGAPGKRFLLANSRVLLHQPHGGAQGQSSDMEIAVREMVEMRRLMIGILADSTGQTVERITADIDRDYILRGDAAVAYGVVDHVVEPSPRRRLALPEPLAVLEPAHA